VLSANVRFGVGPSGTGSELGLVQDLISALQIPLRKKVAAANRERATAEVANAVLDLALQTKESFYRLQGALQLLELRRTVAEATALSREIAERQHAAGNISDLEVATERALHEESKVEFALTEAAVLEDREHLNALLGLWGEQTQWSMPARLPRFPAEDVNPNGLESRAVSQRLDLVVARTQGLSELAQLRLNRFYGLIPYASAGVAAEREPEGGWSLGPALDIPIPLFDQSQALIASSGARLRANEERFRALAVEIRAQVRRARTKLEAARQRAAYYERVLLPLQSQVVEETQRHYNAMQIGPIQLVQAKREQIDVGRRYIETLTEYWIARTELERAVGGELAIEGGSPEAVETPSVPAHGMETHHHPGG
jgi:cobalt-zinc-cadmium efflux system outer membrane protein